MSKVTALGVVDKARLNCLIDSRKFGDLHCMAAEKLRRVRFYLTNGEKLYQKLMYEASTGNGVKALKKEDQ